MDIIFVERIFPLYRKAVFDAIYSRRKFLFFHSIDKKSTIKQTQAEYSVLIRPFRYSSKESGVFLFLFRKLVNMKPKIIVHEYSAGILSKPLLILYCRLSKIKLIFWGHMYDRSKGFHFKKKMADRYRLWLWRRADSLITYSQAEKDLLMDHNVPGQKIFVAFNTVDTNSFLRVRNKLEEAGKSTTKNRLGFQHEFNLTFIGRLYEEKKPELLMDLLVGLKQKGFVSTAVHYIGDGDMAPLLRKRSAELGLQDDVFFHGAIYDETLTGELLFCSDLMIMPGCVGLSINHAFCFNCPVVTFEQRDLTPAHGPEIEYIKNNETGFLISDHSVKTMTDVVAHYLRSPDLRKMMRDKIKNFIEKDCSVERMADGVIEAINYNLKESA